MNYLILVMDFLTAITAFIAGYLWFKASRVRHGLDQIDAADGLQDELLTLKHCIQHQSRLNASGALFACITAVMQGVVFLLTLFKQAS